MRTIRFPSHGESCEGWWLDADVDDLRTPAGRPCVVMAHGFGTTRDSGLLPFAQRFAAAGCDVLLFDYRGFAGSSGSPRQDVDHRRHREDYHAAVELARGRDGVDPDRVAVWGSSYSGGHVIAVAAQDHRIAGVISQGAAVDGRAALTGRGRKVGPTTPPKARSGSKGPRLALAVARDLGRQLLCRIGVGRPPYMIPFLGPLGSGAMISGTGAMAFEALTGPTFRNEMCARGLLRIAFNRPITMAADVVCPTLLIIAEYDEIAPSTSVHEMAQLITGPVEVRQFDTGHFEIYAGVAFERSVEAQVAFLRRVLTPA